MKKRTMPYGYEIRNGEITVDKKAAKIIEEIFTSYLDGMSFGNIADEMTCRGIDYYDGKTKWNKLMVKRILECRFYLGTDKYPKLISNEQFESTAMLIAAKYGGYNKDPRATILKKRTFCQECGERITRDIQSARYHKWYCKGCLDTQLREERFYERILSALNSVIRHPELLDEVEPKDTYESDFEVSHKANELNHMLNNSSNIDFEQTFGDILNLAAMKYDHCELDITEELTETIKQDFIGRSELEDISTELRERTVSHVTLDKSGKVAVHFINGAVVRVGGNT